MLLDFFVCRFQRENSRHTVLADASRPAVAGDVCNHAVLVVKFNLVQLVRAYYRVPLAVFNAEIQDLAAV